MKLLRNSLKLAILLGLATISTAFGAKNTQAQTLAAGQAPTVVPVVLGEIPITATSLRTDKERLTHQEMRLVTMPLSQPPILAQAPGGNGVTWIIFLLGGIIVVAVIMITASGIVMIGENQVGIVRKKFAPLRGSLPPGQRIARNGEAGWQAKVLPTGLHFWHWSLLYEIRREPVVKIPLGQIGLVVANDGVPIPKKRMLGKVVECTDFQDGDAFLNGGGEQGPQLAILTAGDYGINSELFTVITAANAAQQGIDPNKLQVYKVAPGKIGIVTTYDGVPTDDIAGPQINGHNKFQDGQKFIDEGGCRGWQEEIIPAGAWNLNPWFVDVEQVPLTEIPPATVGVVISSVGKTPKSGASHDLVEAGYKGTQKEPLYPGTHPINTRVMSVVIVPTDEITLEWSNKPKPSTNYDAQLHALKLRSKDTFAFNIEVTQVIKIDGKNAPKMISHVGSPAAWTQQLIVGNYSNHTNTKKYISIKNLVVKVLEPMVSGKFYIAVQNYKALEFRDKRSQVQREAADHIKSELSKYGVQAVGTFIKEIDLPDKLEKQITDAAVAELEEETLRRQLLTEQQRQKLAYERALTDIQKDLVQYEQGVQFAELKALAQRYIDSAEADATRDHGKAQADIMQAIIDVLGRDGYLDLEKIKELVKLKLPDFWFNNSDGNSSSSIQALIASVLHPAGQQRLHDQLVGVPKQKLPAQPTEPPKLDSSLSQTTEPRCPVVLLLDTSSSMPHECINQLNAGIATFKREISTNTTASRCVEVAVITFGGSAQVAQDFTTVEKFSPPQLVAGGTTALGQGLELALSRIESRTTTYKNNGIQNLKPWVFLITASTPADEWEYAARLNRQTFANGTLNFFAVGIQGVELDILRQIAPPKVPPAILDPLKIQKLFYWLADSLKKVSSNDTNRSVSLSPITEWGQI